MFLAIFDRRVHQLGVLGFLGSGEDEGRIGGGILRLVLRNCCELSAMIQHFEVDVRTIEVTGVADHGLVVLSVNFR